MCNRCAAGAAFQAVDVVLNGLNNGSEFDWGLMFVTPSQQNSSDDREGRSVYKCRNCRCDFPLCACIQFGLSDPRFFIFAATRFASTMCSRFIFIALNCACTEILLPATSPQLQQPVLLLKMDTEGAEESALQGLTDLLEAKQVCEQSYGDLLL